MKFILSFLLILFVTTPAHSDTYFPLNKIIDSSDAGYKYAYAPSIIRLDGKFHAFFCSTGLNGGWDAVRYAWSHDGRVWSNPTVAVGVSDKYNERAACDPSVVKFNRGDGDYFYLFYSGNKTNVQTVMFVARATSIAGPYYKYTNRNTWEINPSDPKIIISPIAAKPENAHWYGAGQQSVVNRNGILYSWFTDDTSGPTQDLKLYYTTSTDGVNWSSRIFTGVRAHSPDIKYDPIQNRFVMYQIDQGHGVGSYLARRHSMDGVAWSEQEIICDAACFPDYAHNVGVSGDLFGHLIGTAALVAYGAGPDMISEQSWGVWDLAASTINPRGTTWNGIPFGWQGVGNNSSFKPVKGDFDGDGKADAAVVNMSTGQWYVQSSLTGQQGVPGIPWGWQWGGWTTSLELAVGDYDGDGKADRAVVNRNDSSWYVISSAGLASVPGISWGWKWSGMTTVHQIIADDYDGDGKTDRAIVNKNTGEWYVISSINQQLGVPGIPFGWKWNGWNSSYKPIVEDFDGDNKADRAAVNMSSGQWYVISSKTNTNGVPEFPWGWPWGGWSSTLKPIVGDYDGDGKADRAVVNPANSSWYVITSSGANVVPFGWQWQGMASHFEIIPADYDGDKKVDRAIRNPSTGQWYVLGSIPFEIY
jgi:hypothetical protein